MTNGALAPAPPQDARHPRAYNGVPALKGVDFDLYEGEIHALVGEHRAGKSSLVKLMSGAVQKSQGEIIYRGAEVKSFTPESAIRAGVGMVYQNLTVLPSLNAIENIFAGRMIQRRFMGLDRRRMFLIGRELFQRMNIEIDLELPLLPPLPGTAAHGGVRPDALPESAAHDPR